ncbi:MAG: molybdopterin molybdenumtransferase MoeA, partial [Deltaproteobacteria bacterium]
MKTVKEAQTIILEHVSPLKAENVPIESSLGRILAEDVSSNRNHPPYDMSAMDGYAVRHVDIKDATKASPAILSIVDDIRAGVEPICAIKDNEASRIMTGAAVPEGADTVVRVEDTDYDGTKVKIFVPASKGTDIRR